MTRLQKYRVAGEPVEIRTVEDGGDVWEFLDWVAKQPGSIACDTETTGDELYDPNFRIRLIQFGNATEAWCLPVDYGYNWIIKRVLNEHSREFEFHNAPYDVVALHVTGFVDGYEFIDRVYDSYIPSHVYDPRDTRDGGVGHKLKEVVRHYIDSDAPDAEQELKRVFKEEVRVKKLEDGWRTIDVYHPAYTLYSGLDPIFARRLRMHFTPEMRKMRQEYLVEFEHQVQQVTTRMTLRGMPVDVDYLTKLSADLLEEADHWAGIAAEHGIENVKSTQQVAAALIEQGWKPKEFTEKSGEPMVKDRILQFLDYPAAEAVMKSKKASHYRTAYTEAMLRLKDADDMVHPIVAALRARTTRMSISSPPFQQLPSEDQMIRSAIIPYPGWSIVSSDYGQVEMRVLAALSKEPNMLQGILDGIKIHKIVATMMFGEDYTDRQYKLAKNTGFGEVFGGGAKKLAEQASTKDHVITEADAKQAKKYFSEGFPGIKQWSKWLMEEAKFNGYSVTTPLGRRLPVDENRLYSVTNYMIQSSAREIFCQDLLMMSEMGLEPYIMLPVHDEVLAQAPQGDAEELANTLQMIMETPDWKGVPIAAEAEVYGKSWGEGYIKDE